MTRTIGTLLVTAALVAGACSGDDASDDAGDITVPIEESTTTSSSTTEPTTTTEDPTAAVEQAFYDQWDAFVEITSAPDIEHPLIDQHFTGEAKEALLDVVSQFIADGQAARLPDDPENFQPRITGSRVESDSDAIVFECTVDGAVIFDVETGEIVDDAVGTYEGRNKFKLIDGRWKLESSRPLTDGDPSCAEA